MEEVRKISVTQLCRAYTDPEFFKALRRDPTAKPPFYNGSMAESAGPVLMGGRFHQIVSSFVLWLVANPQELIWATPNDVWIELYERVACPILTELAQKGNVEGAGNLATALRAFCARLVEIRARAGSPTGWNEVLLAQEYPIDGIPLCSGSIWVSGKIDALRIAKNGGIELADYKLNSGAKLDLDLVQLAIYARLLKLSPHRLELDAVLEYYEPDLHEIPVSLSQLDGIFDAKVEPVLRALCDRQGTHPPAVPPKTDGKKRDGPRAYRIGHRKGAPFEEVNWDVDQSLPHPVNNFGVFVTGDAGSGKTQVLKALIADAASNGHAVMIFDFKNDFTESFAKDCGLTAYDLRAGVPFNPLRPPPNEGGNCQPIEHIYEVTGILAQCLKLGDQQQALFRDCLTQSFVNQSVAVNDWVRADQIKAPGLGDVIALVEKNAARHGTGLKNKLGMLHGLRLFPSDSEATVRFNDLINQKIVLLYSNLPTDPNLKRVMAELILIQAHGHLLRGDQPRRLARVFAFDEAHHAANSKRLVSLAREGRAFGVGVFAGTQFSDDLSPDLTGNLATKIHFFNSDGNRRKKIVSQILGATVGREAQALLDELGNLKQFEAVVSNPHHNPYVATVTEPYFRRKK